MSGRSFQTVSPRNPLNKGIKKEGHKERPEPRRTPADTRRFTALIGRALLVRVLILAVGTNHVDSRIEVHRIDAVAAVYGVYTRVVVSLDHVSADSSAYLVDPS